MKRFLTLILVLAMTIALAACGQTSDVDTDSLSDVPGSAQSSAGSETLSDSDDAPADSPASTDSVSESDPDALPENAISLTLKYDDRYQFPHAIEKIKTVTVTSKQIDSEDLDTDVIVENTKGEAGSVIAAGVGNAAVFLENGDVYNVTVEPAVLSVLLILGQSNGEGSTTGDAVVYNKARSQSVLCEEGQIYSTYGWSTTGHATTVAGLTSSKALGADNASKFVAESLTSIVDREGRKLEYPLNSLSSGGKGKTGFDSGLAWGWHEFTGEKVWVVNCAAGSTEIISWQKGRIRYNNCLALIAEVRITLEAEIAAGHYTLNKFSGFWLQGESDSGLSEADYTSRFAAMYTDLKADLYLTENKPLDGLGIIMVRAFETTFPAMDTWDNGPRKAQKAAIAATDGVFADVYLACIENDKWIEDGAVASYWAAAYPDANYPFPLRTAYPLPEKITDVHNGIHYFQPGYNEIGVVSAKNAAAHFGCAK